MRLERSTLLSMLVTFSLGLGACSESAPTGDLAAVRAGLDAPRSLVRLYGENPLKLRALAEAQGLDVTGSSVKQGFVEVVARPDELAAFQRAHAARITRTKVEPARGSKALSDYHDPAEVEAYLAQVEADHPAIAQRRLLTDALPEGHPIWALKISDQVAQDEDEPTFLMDGGIHAREVMPVEVMVDAIDQLTTGYGSDPQITRWVDGLEIWIVPTINPDGAAYMHASDDWWRKNRSHACGADVGVDLNRNFAWTWRACEGSAMECWDDTYHGSSAASEVETQALQALMAELRPLYYINYHSYGELILWPTGCGQADEDALLRGIGQELNQLVPTDSGQVGQWTIGTPPEVLYTAPGGADDHAYGAHGSMGFVFELNQDGFQPDFATWRNITVQRQRLGWGHLLDRSLDGPSLQGHVFDAASLAPVQATWMFANHPFGSGQLPLETDAQGRFGRVVLPDSEHVVVFTASGYLPAAHVVQVEQGPVYLEVPLTAGVNHPPVAQATGPGAADEGTTVALDASGSSDPDGNTLVFTWTQTAGPTARLREAFSARPSFFAPSVDADTSLTFEVVASDGELSSAPVEVSLTVRDRWNETTIFPSDDTPIDIPDYDPIGVTSVIHVAEDRPVLRAVAHVEITHTWIGDLWIGLSSPAGTQVVLHDHTGGDTDNLHADFELPEVAGELSGGDWTLTMIDAGPSDLGVLVSWELHLDLVGEATCNGDEDCVLDHATATCQDGLCVLTGCDEPWADCDGSAYNGCEVDTSSDTANCGGCAQPCALAHATSACAQGACAVTACDATYADCDLDPVNGCEVSTLTDLAHCGGCAQPCALAHATPVCAQGACAIAACDADQADCDLDPASGCEVSTLTDPTHCGGCDQPCALAHATPVCAQGACAVATCEADFGDCDQLPATGCEVDTSSDAANCGGCDQPCALAHATPACAQGTCAIAACDEDQADCDLDPASGCEVSTLTDPANCGGCDQPCALAHATPACAQGACAVAACEAGFGDCDQLPVNGCEVDTSSDDAHCGGCDQPCTLAHATPACAQGACAVAACEAGFGDCDQLPANGCEVDTSSDAAHCGGCDQPCALAHATPACAQGACAVAACEAGFGDCDQLPANGCEIDTRADLAHCGQCGHACAQGDSCQATECVPCPDLDQDGHQDAVCGGDDCDDSRPGVNPGAPEDCSRTLDEDCDGLTDEDCGDTGGGGCGCGATGQDAAPGLALLLGLAACWRRRRPR